MLLDDTSTVDANDFSAREGFPNQAQGFCIQIRLVVGRTKHRPVDHEEVGVGGRQPFSVKKDRPWHGQFHEVVGRSF